MYFEGFLGPVYMERAGWAKGEQLPSLAFCDGRKLPSW